jgi:hypothetical protein
MKHAPYIAHAKCFAPNYSLAIKEIGAQMDDLWDSGNWRLISCVASPIQTDSGAVVMWEWEIDVEWLGL